MPHKSSIRRRPESTLLSDIPVDLQSSADLTSRTHDPLFRVHIDGFEFHFQNSIKCFYIYTDEGTDFKMVYFVKDKTAESFLTTLQTFHALAYYHHKTNIKTIRTDNGSEMSSEIFYDYARFNNIHLQRCAPYNHNQNGLAERSVRTCEEVALTLLHHAHLSVPLFISYAVSNAVQIRNKCVTKGTKERGCTPFQLFTGVKPKLEDIHVIGQTCFSYIQKDQRKFKYHPKARQCIFLCEDYERKAFLLMDVESRSVISSRDVRFTRLGASVVTPADFSPLSLEGQRANAEEARTPDNSEHYEENRHDVGDNPLPVVGEPANHASTADDVRPQTPPLIISNESWSELYPNVEPSSSVSIFPRLGDSSDSENDDNPFPVAECTVPAFVPECELDGELVIEASVDDDVPPALSAPVSTPFSDTPSTTNVPSTSESEAVSSRGRKVTSNSKYFNSEFVNNLSIPATPKTYLQAVKSPQSDQWNSAMRKELASLQQHGTWHLVPRTKDMVVVRSKWVYKIKLDERGAIERYKARVVAMGFTQTYGVDFDDTFAPVLNSVTRRVLFSLVARPHMISVQADVETAFLQSELDYKIFLSPPQGMEVPDGFVLQLLRAIYGLKQSPLLWYTTLSNYLKSIGFIQCVSDVCLFTLTDGGSTIVLCIYVDDLILASESQTLIDMVLGQLKERFPIRDVKKLSWTVGLHIDSLDPGGSLRVSQQSYIDSLVEKYISNDKNQKSYTPMVVDNTVLFDSTSPKLERPQQVKFYQEIIGSLNYLCHASRPDIMIAVNILSRFLQAPREMHLQAALRIIKYLNAVPNFSIRYAELPNNLFLLCAFCDASFAATPYEDGRSTTGILIYFNGSLIFWRSTRQSIISLSAMEAELQAIAQTVTELQWIRNVLHELSFSVTSVTIFTDSEPAMKYLYQQAHVLKPRTRHLALRYHFVRKEIQEGSVVIKYIPSKKQRADMLTKPLARPQFEILRELLAKEC
tara:strand:- start:112 stop:3054 length:2943 start_codon:yes stop_codon:yes gene_type:complete